MTAKELTRAINGLRAERVHLYAQVRGEVDTTYATKEEANERLTVVERALADAENAARNVPECAYLFRKTSRRGVTKTSKVLTHTVAKSGNMSEDQPAVDAVPQNQRTQAGLLQGRRREAAGKSKTATNQGGNDMARKSNQQQLDEVVAELKKAEKSAGSTKWALSGAGAAKNPPSEERAAHLSAKLEAEQAKIAELRAKRDELKAKIG